MSIIEPAEQLFYLPEGSHGCSFRKHLGTYVFETFFKIHSASICIEDGISKLRLMGIGVTVGGIFGDIVEAVILLKDIFQALKVKKHIVRVDNDGFST